MRKKQPFGRRTFLASAAALGAGASIPHFLTGSRAQEGEIPKRFVLVTLGHSIQPRAAASPWLPAAGPLTSLPDFMAPLDEFRDRMLIVGGVDNLINGLVSTNGHNGSSRTLQTCMPHADAIAADGSLSSDAPELDYQSASGGPSIEYVMADRLGGSPFTLRAGERNGEHRRTFRLDSTDDQGESSPLVAFTDLLGTEVPPPTALTPRQQLALRRNDVMNTVQANYRALSSRVGREDRERLEIHANLIRNFQDELGRMVEVVCEDPRLPAPSGFPDNVEDGSGRSDDIIVPTHNSLIAMALACQATQVVSLHYSSMQENQFPFINGGSDMFGDPGWHGVTHHDGGTDEERVRVLTWYSSMIADLLTKLAATPDVEGSVLDNTVVLVTSSLGSSSHSTSNLPVLFFGGSNSGLATGQAIDYRDSSRRTLGDLWVSTLQLMGIDETSFGWNRGDFEGRAFNNGPLSEIFSA